MMKAFFIALTILTIGSEMALAQRFPGPRPGHRPGPHRPGHGDAHPMPRPAQNTCRCEDRNYDGRYGIIRYSPHDRLDTGLTVASNLGTYGQCERIRTGYNSCNSRAQAIYTCEDQDRNGYFGVVKYDRFARRGVVIYGNYGTLHQCVRYASRL